ncbi:MAG: hypothetical protein HYS27_14525 [Deltaproteobacteria bacterium]|nr:hypothetical protein [Deltaproteobacteria bacterium]
MVLVLAATLAGAGCCVDNFLVDQALTPDGNLGAASAGEAPPGGLWWIPGALDAVRIETYGQPETARDVEVVVATNTSTAVRVPSDLEVGTTWSVAAPGPDVDRLVVIAPEDLPEPLGAEDLAAPFVRAGTLQTTHSYCTSVTNPFPPLPVSVVDLVFQTSLTGDRWARVFLDVWLLEDGEVPTPDGVVRAVDSQHLGSELDLFPALFDPEDTTLHISPATLPTAGGAVVVRLRDKATAVTGELGRYEP